MQVLYKKSFQKDLLKIRDRKLKESVAGIVELAEKIKDPSSLPQLKKLKGFKNYFRIRIGDYRIGIQIIQSTITFVTIGHRKDIYKDFP